MKENLSLRIKRIFLNYLQGYFANHGRYTWTENVRSTKIFIADKYAIETGKPPVKPSIVLVRGPLQWAQVTRGEPTHVKLYNRGAEGLLPKATSTYTDLLTTTIQLQVLAKDPSEADFLATEIFTLISATRNLIYAEGVHKITNIGMSDEQPMFQGATMTWTRVTVNFTVMWEQTVGQSEEEYAAKLTTNLDRTFVEGLHYTVEENGTKIRLHQILDPDESVTIDYKSAITLQQKNKINLLLVPGEDILYLVPDSDAIYGYYKILQDIYLTDDTTNIETRV